MKKVLLTILLLSLFVMSTANTVDAHSLQWGVKLGDEYVYSAKGTRQDIGVVDVEFKLKITHLGNIQSDIEWLGNWPVVSITLTNMKDGATLDMGNDISELAYSSYTSVPIGDWDYLTSQINYVSDTVGRSVTETQSTWGFTESSATTSIYVQKIVSYDKTTGIMNYFYGYYYDNIADEIISEVTIELDADYVPETTTTSTTTTTTTSNTGTTTTVIVDNEISGIIFANFALSVTVAVESGIIIFLLFIVWKELIR